MEDLNEPIARPPMLYAAPINFSLSEALYLKADQEGNCKNCGDKLDTTRKQETFYKDAGYGFDWIVSNRVSGLCQHCFDELKAKSKQSNYVPEKVRRVGKYTVDEIEHEIIEADPYYAPIPESEKAFLLRFMNSLHGGAQ